MKYLGNNHNEVGVSYRFDEQATNYEDHVKRAFEHGLFLLEVVKELCPLDECPAVIVPAASTDKRDATLDICCKTSSNTCLLKQDTPQNTADMINQAARLAKLKEALHDKNS